MEWSNPLASLANRLKDNPISRKMEQRDRLVALLAQHRAHQEYPWFQGTEKGVIFTGGICHGMSFDWLRRKFLNKRNYNDVRYASTVKDPGNFSFYSKVRDLVLPEDNEKRKQLMQKAGEIQAGFYNELRNNRERWQATLEKLRKDRKGDDLTPEDMLREDSTLVNPNDHDAETQILRKFALSRVKKMRGLESFNVGVVRGEWLSTETVVKSKGDVVAFLNQHIANMTMEPSDLQRGLMVSFQDENRKLIGHATAVFDNQGDRNKAFVFFDPNCGEFFWDKSFELSAFVGDLWEIAYSELKELELRTITLDPRDVPPKEKKGEEKRV